MSTTDDAVMRELDKVIVSVDPAAKVEVEDVIKPVMASTVTAVPDTVLELYSYPVKKLLLKSMPVAEPLVKSKVITVDADKVIVVLAETATVPALLREIAESEIVMRAVPPLS